MGCPMYSSAVYPSTFISVSLAQSTWPVPESQCIAIGALFRKSSSSRSEGGSKYGASPAPAGGSAQEAPAGPEYDRRPVMINLPYSAAERARLARHRFACLQLIRSA